MSSTKGKHMFLYRLSPETFGYTLVSAVETRMPQCRVLWLWVKQANRLALEVFFCCRG